MNQYDIRTTDSEDPNTPQDIIKAVKKGISDASEKYETFEVTHEPINLKTKLALKKQAAAAKANALAEQAQIATEEHTAENASAIDD